MKQQPFRIGDIVVAHKLSCWSSEFTDNCPMGVIKPGDLLEVVKTDLESFAAKHNGKKYGFAYDEGNEYSLFKKGNLASSAPITVYVPKI